MQCSIYVIHLYETLFDVFLVHCSRFQFKFWTASFFNWIFCTGGIPRSKYGCNQTMAVLRRIGCTCIIIFQILYFIKWNFLVFKRTKGIEVRIKTDLSYVLSYMEWIGFEILFCVWKIAFHLCVSFQFAFKNNFYMEFLSTKPF